MPIPDKTQTALPVSSGTATLPAVIPELPGDVLKRFPSLTDWQDQMQRLHTRLREALDTTTEDLAGPLNVVLTDTKNLSATADSLSARINAAESARIEGDAALAETISSIVAAAGTSNSVFVQASSPTANSINDIWFDTDDGMKQYFWNGTAWANATDTRLTAAISAISAEQTTRANADSALTMSINSLSATVASNQSYILTTLSSYATLTFAEAKKTEAITAAAADATAKVSIEAGARASAVSALSAYYAVSLDVGGRVVGRIRLDGTDASSSFLVAADKFQLTNGAGTVTLLDIRSGGNIVFGASVQSDNYVAGSTGFFLNRDTGNVEFSDGTFRGALYSSTGTIGGFTIGTDSLAAGSGSSFVEFGISTGIKVGTSTSVPGFGNSTTGFAVEPSTNSIFVSRSDNFAASFNRNSFGAVTIFSCFGTIVGSVSVTSTNAAYNTTSDRRLKTSIMDAPEVGDLIDRLRVRDYEFIRAPGKRHLGFIAQELYGTYADAVTPGDFTDTIVETWGVDHSKLVPLLVREIQSLRRRMRAANL